MTQTDQHNLFDQQSGWDTDKVSSWRGHEVICKPLGLDRKVKSEDIAHRGGQIKASGNELRIKSSLKIGMTEEGVMSSTVLQLCWGEL